ncbi:MAG: AAA family ATPase [Eubacterium sp.]|nr:AAA family ATPase [Eubacterium sp.]
MYVTKLLIRDFGRFHNKNMDFTQGINIVVGNDGTGKSTLRDFIVGLIYGIPRREGITKVRSNYELRKPKGRSGYSGTAYIKCDDKSYLVERNFLAGARKASVLDVASGRDVRLNNVDTLSGTLCETDKNTYLDTRCIIEDESSRADLQEYLANLTLTGTSNINKDEAIKYLENEKRSHVPRPLIRRLDELDEKMSEYETVDDEIEVVEEELKRINDEFMMEAERRKREARQMVENEDGTVSYEKDDSFDEKIDILTGKDSTIGASDRVADAEEAAEKERKKKEKEGIKFTDRVPVILGTGVLVVLIIAGIVTLLPFEPVIRSLFVIFTALFVLYTIFEGFRIKGYFSGDSNGEEVPDEDEFQRVLDELKEEAAQQEQMEIDMEFAKDYQEQKEILNGMLEKLLERRGERNKLRQEFDQVFKKKSELEDDMKAIDFAIKKINALAEKYRVDAFKNLLGHVSTYIGALTLGEFRGLTFNSAGEAVLKGDYKTVPLSNLSQDDSRKVYLAVRLSIAKFLAKEKLPLIIDGTSSIKSEEEIKALVDSLVSMNEEQIIILTDNAGMNQVFKNKGVKTNLITL